MLKRAGKCAAVLLGCLSCVTPAVGQFRQYSPPGSLREPLEDLKTQLDEAIEGARWNWGGLRVDPVFALGDVLYVTDVFRDSSGEQQSDWSASVDLGLEFFLPAGRKTILYAQAVPRYTWWNEQEERRQLNGRYSAEVFGFFNRLTLELGVGVEQNLQFATPEVEQLTTVRNERVGAGFELGLGRSFYWFTDWRLDEARYNEGEPDDAGIAPFDRNDRDEEMLRSGFRFGARDEASVGVGVAWTDTEFADLLFDRSNSGASPFVQAELDREPWFLYGDVYFLDLEPEAQSAFVATSEVTGSFGGTWSPNRTGYSVYYRRELTYALLEDYSHFLQERYGFVLTVEVGRSAQLGGFLESGLDDYVAIGALAPQREDDVESWGLTFATEIGERLEFDLLYADRDYESTLPVFDRSVTQIRVGLTLSVFGGRIGVRG